jgi:hypothetical protein
MPQRSFESVFTTIEGVLKTVREEIIPPLLVLERGVLDLARQLYEIGKRWLGEPLYRLYVSTIPGRITEALHTLWLRLQELFQHLPFLDSS